MSGSDFSVGHLDSMELTLGMAVTSDFCKRMNRPYVSAVVQTTEGKEKVTSLEMSIEQFQMFAKAFRDIDQLMGEM